MFDYFIKESGLAEETGTTKTRLLDAAEELFAQRDYDDVSVRELAAAAQVNVAAINYHFQGKENLFNEVILRRFVDQRNSTLAALEMILTRANGQPDLSEVIGTLVGEYLRGTLGRAENGAFFSLMSREMQADRSHAHGAFYKEMVAPVFQAFSRALMAAHPGLRQEDLNWIIASIVGQVHHFILRWRRRQTIPGNDESLQVMTRVFPALDLGLEEYIRQVADHITRFSTAAVQTMYPEVE